MLLCNVQTCKRQCERRGGDTPTICIGKMIEGEEIYDATCVSTTGLCQLARTLRRGVANVYTNNSPSREMS